MELLLRCLLSPAALIFFRVWPSWPEDVPLDSFYNSSLSRSRHGAGVPISGSWGAGHNGAPAPTLTSANPSRLRPAAA